MISEVNFGVDSKLPFDELSRLLESEYFINTRDLRKDPPDISAESLLDHELAAKWTVLPLERAGDRLWVAMYDPLDYGVIAELQDLTGLFIEPVLAQEQDIRYFLNQMYSSAQIETIASQFLVDENIRKISLDADLRAQLQSAPTVQLVDSLIESAVLYQASDIHIEPYEHIMRARFRIDGQLANPRVIKGSLLPSVISRLKIMGGMNIAEKRLPQDGSFSLNFHGKPIDFRLSTLPTQYGEKAVIRLLYSQSKRFGISELGFLPEDMPAINRLFKRPHGAVIITGPTGSGKTTTLTGFMSELNDEKVNITTVEDPVENPIEGVNHVAVDYKTGFNFPMALRHILRQDPDIIMVGEIRDNETASIAMRASITGHLMLSTLHTNDAAGVFPRLVDMGVEPFLAAASLNGIIAQRLVRRLCGFCKVEDTSGYLRQLIACCDQLTDAAYAPNGCNQCGNTGYKGRFAIYEYISMDDAMRSEMASCDYNLSKVEGIMRRGMSTMLDNGVKNVLLGHTSAEEVLRVVYRE